MLVVVEDESQDNQLTNVPLWVVVLVVVEDEPQAITELSNVSFWVGRIVPFWVGH